MTSTVRPETVAVRAGIQSDAHHGAVVPPIHLSANYSFAGLGLPREYDYSRSGNPTRDLVGEALAELEGGAGGIVTATGMAAVTLVLTLVRPGERVLAPFDCYGGTHRLLAALQRTGRIDVSFVNFTDFSAVARALVPAPRLVWIETPSNPLLRITDIAAVSRLAHDAGALVAVDNTFLSPAWQSPIELGADLVAHSTTKYINGHSDVVGGAVVARDAALHEELAWWANCLGITGSPFDSYLTLRGLRTLHVRMRQHAENAGAIASRLDDHPAVRKRFLPGPAGPRRPRTRRAPATRIWRDRQLRARRRGGSRAALRRRPALLLARGVARRRREPDCASRDHDARRHGPRRTRRGRHHARPAAPVGGHRGGGRPDCGPGRGAGAGAIARGAARSGIGRDRSPQ